MQSGLLLHIATALFAFAALGGILMAAIRFSGRPRPPSWLAIGHGILAATGLCILIFVALTEGLPIYAQLALGIFLMAAAGGLAIHFLFHRRQLPLPIPLILLHAALAVCAFVLLLISVF